MVAFKIIRVIFATGVVLSALGLIVAAALKVQDLGAFRDALGSHGVLPAFALDFAPLPIVGFEVFVGAAGLWLIVRHQWRTAALVVAPIYLAFVFYAVALTIHPPASPVPCGCGFSSRVVESWLPLAVRNAGFFSFLLVAARFLTNQSAINTDAGSASPTHSPAGA